MQYTMMSQTSERYYTIYNETRPTDRIHPVYTMRQEIPCFFAATQTCVHPVLRVLVFVILVVCAMLTCIVLSWMRYRVCSRIEIQKWLLFIFMDMQHASILLRFIFEVLDRKFTWNKWLGGGAFDRVPRGDKMDCVGSFCGGVVGVGCI